MSINELIKFFSLKSKIEEVEFSKDLEVGDKKGLSVNFSDLSFSYRNEKEGKIVEISRLNLSIKEGQLVLIKGPSGVGKTTLVNLLLRLYDPKEGKVELNSQNVKDLKFSF